MLQKHKRKLSSDKEESENMMNNSQYINKIFQLESNTWRTPQKVNSRVLSMDPVLNSANQHSKI